MSVDREKNESELVTRIRNLCKEHGISMRKLERDCEFGNGLVSKWSYSSPSIQYLKKVAEHFGVSINYLIGEKEVEPTGSKYEFPHNIINEARAEYSTEDVTGRIKGTNQKIDIQHMIKYLVKIANGNVKEVTYKGRPLTTSELKELKAILKHAQEEAKVFDKKGVKK